MRPDEAQIGMSLSIRPTSRGAGKEGREPDRNVLPYLRTGSASRGRRRALLAFAHRGKSGTLPRVPHKIDAASGPDRRPYPLRGFEGTSLVVLGGHDEVRVRGYAGLGDVETFALD